MHQKLNYDERVHNSAEKNTMKIRYQADLSDISDVCLFSSFSFSGKVEEYVYYYLSELKKAGFSIVFVTTSPLSDPCIDRLSQYTFLIIERENKCPDFGSWKAGLSLLDWGKDLNSVLLVNDSVFGPFFDLANIISSMNKRYDVWGMTDNYEIEHHLQSYFLYFNTTVLASETWSSFWNNVDISLPKEKVILQYEIGLSGLLRRANFRLGAYAGVDIISKSVEHFHKDINVKLGYWELLIQQFNLPFLKRELLIRIDIHKVYWGRGMYINVGKWKSVIEKASSYPVIYIEDFINSYYQTIRSQSPDVLLRNRKLLILSHNADIGGAQRVLLNFLQWLKKETDIDLEIIICNLGKDNEWAGEFSRSGTVSNFYDLSEMEKIKLKERLIDEQIGLIFSNTITDLNINKFFSFLDVPQIVFVHDTSFTLKDSLSADDDTEWMKNNIVHFITSSEAAGQTLAEDVGIENAQVDVVHKFIDPYDAEQFEKESKKIKSDLGIPPDAFVVGLCGTFEWKNSADLLPVIAKSLCSKNNNIHIIWLGADISSTLYRPVEFDLERSGLRERVHLVPKSSDSRPFFSAFEIFVMASRQASFPVVNLESGLAGKPVICFRGSGGSEEYTSLGTGHAVPYLDISALSEKVLGYYNDRERLHIETKKISRIVKDNFTTSVQAPKILQIIREYYDDKQMMLKEELSVTFMTHIYYEDSWDEIRNKLKYFDNGRNYFLFSISEACLAGEQIIEDIKLSFKNAYFLVTSNIGKDIGGKMALIDLYLLLDIGSSHIVFLHDKQSPHSIEGESWKNSLFKIIDPNYQKLILHLFKDPKIGVIGTKNYIVNEYDKTTGTFLNNNQLSKKLLKQFGISIDNYDFLGGSMYWLRSSIIKKFFTTNNPILMRENLEAGNVLDNYGETLAHTWERMFCWIAAKEGYTIKGI